jgi:hypothetical protein
MSTIYFSSFSFILHSAFTEHNKLSPFLSRACIHHLDKNVGPEFSSIEKRVT